MSKQAAENDAWECDHHPEWADGRNVCHHPAHTAESDAAQTCRDCAYVGYHCGACECCIPPGKGAS